MQNIGVATNTQRVWAGLTTTGMTTHIPAVKQSRGRSALRSVLLKEGRLSNGEDVVIVINSLLSKYQRVTNGQMEMLPIWKAYHLQVDDDDDESVGYVRPLLLLKTVTSMLMICSDEELGFQITVERGWKVAAA